MRDQNSRLFVFMHGDEEEQKSFIKLCQENDCFAQAIPFMVRQRPKSIYPRSKNNEPLDTQIYFNGERPYLTVSNANPYNVGEYCNWTYLESAIERGWQSQFS